MKGILSIVLFLSMVTMAEIVLPSIDLRVLEKPPLLTTWAHAGGKVAMQLESVNSQSLTCDIYQVDERIVIPISRDVILTDLKPGANRLEIPLPEKSERGKLLFKIIASPEAKHLADLMVDILPKDALDSLIRQSKQGQVWIDPQFKGLHVWAKSHGISSTEPTTGKPIAFHFGKPTGTLNPKQSGRFFIYERDQPDAMPILEIIRSPDVTKILLPPGFLAEVPHSAVAEALMLRHLHLLP